MDFDMHWVAAIQARRGHRATPRSKLCTPRRKRTTPCRERRAPRKLELWGPRNRIGIRDHSDVDLMLEDTDRRSANLKRLDVMDEL